jgi:hypothetical protein
MDLETVGFYVLILGLALAVIGWLWFLVRAFKVRFLWGVAILLLPPVALLFLLRHGRQARGPVGVLLLAGVVIAIPYGVNVYQRFFPNLGPREKIVDGELHITLTGWDRTDYAVLQAKPNVVVLQMANPDVNDGTLVYVKEMNRLRELDLNDTQVSDEGLRLLVELPQLAELRLARTRITDEGFRQYLSEKPSLRKLDLTGTAVLGKTKRAWKNAQPGRDYLD